AILNDGTFGEVLVGGEDAWEWKEVFGWVEWLGGVGVGRLCGEVLDVVVMEEFDEVCGSW
ncbi:hypothetical protein, partial [Micrococcus luteus]|uniref:hypothetical protein n=1 Tax=Micrococcus luteus TaxID=1270 RepID=UPI001C931369